MVKFVGVGWVKLVFTKIMEFRKLDIVITNDRSSQERERRKELLNHVQLLKVIGIQASIKKLSLFVNDREMKA